MNSLSKRIELLANIMIIVVGVLLVGVLVRNYLWPGARQGASDAAAAQLKPGDKLSLPGVDWARGDKTLLLALSDTCRFCTESAEFYRGLARAKADRPGVRLVAVLPQDTDRARAYLSKLNVEVDEVRQSQPDALGVRGTPTLVLVDREGAATDVWVGKLPAEKEAEVHARAFR